MKLSKKPSVFKIVHPSQIHDKLENKRILGKNFLKMDFEENYRNIKNIIEEDLNFLEQEINNLFLDETPLNKQLLSFLKAPSKRLRPVLGFLFLRCLFGKISLDQHKILLSVELIHNATLIHDDVIDNASKRRSQKTINAEFDDNLAVVAGDFLLSIALEKVIDTDSIEVLKNFTTALKSACIGEINQYFSKFNISSIEKYIEKSKEKTAMLFQSGILGGLLLSEDKTNDKLKQAAIDFSENFGIAFQIRDDLLNILNSDDLKPNLNDLNSGIYTAPVIFAYQNDTQLPENENILAKIKSTGAIEKTKELMDNYFNKAILAIKDFEDNKYKLAILGLIELLKTTI